MRGPASATGHRRPCRCPRCGERLDFAPRAGCWPTRACQTTETPQRRGRSRCGCARRAQRDLAAVAAARRMPRTRSATCARVVADRHLPAMPRAGRRCRAARRRGDWMRWTRRPTSRSTLHCLACGLRPGSGQFDVVPVPVGRDPGARAGAAAGDRCAGARLRLERGARSCAEPTARARLLPRRWRWHDRLPRPARRSANSVKMQRCRTARAAVCARSLKSVYGQRADAVPVSRMSDGALKSQAARAERRAKRDRCRAGAGSRQQSASAAPVEPWPPDTGSRVTTSAERQSGPHRH